MDSQQTAEKFKRFAEMECRESSELYEVLANQIADDEEILCICQSIPDGQPVPNLLFAGVQYLLLQGAEHPLKDYYPSLTASPKAPDQRAFLKFKDFCLTHQSELTPILAHRLVQTNEVRRCA